MLIAGLMRQPADLLLLDEPTNDLDIRSLEVLENSLRDFPGALVLVTHDRYIIDQVVDTIVEVADQALKIYPGNYSEYLYKKELDRQSSQAASNAPRSEPASEEKSDWEEAKRRKAREAAEERKRLRLISELEHRIATLEARQRQLESPSGGLADPEVYRNGDRMKGLMNQFDSNKQELQRLLDRWEHYHAKGE
ncbi:TPA: hypothetical protein DCG35_01055 [Candidatus Edwardsbacteria bacterium]|nr:hypothetical protein [Candidatus Edwardsbacteria bacterium]